MMRQILTPVGILAPVGVLGLIWATMAMGRAEDLTSPTATINTTTTSPAMIADLKYLTSEELRGRSAVGTEILKAADYIAGRYTEIGLETNLYDGSAFQPVEMVTAPQASDEGDNEIQFVRTDDSEPVTLTMQDGFSPLAVGATQGEVTAEIVWLGYGISASEFNYDDYALSPTDPSVDIETQDVKGKIVMMLRKEPGFADPDSPFDGVKNTRHAFFDTKIATAVDQGAAAVLLINDPASVDRMVQAINSRFETETKRLDELQKQLDQLPAEAANLRAAAEEKIEQTRAMLSERDADVAVAQMGVLGISEAGTTSRRGNERVTDPTTGKRSRRPAIPVASISRQTADKLLRDSAAEVTDADLRKVLVDGLEGIEAAIDSDFKPRSFAIPGVRAVLKVAISDATATSPNVLGVLPGKGALSDETIVIGAHYDHVGMGGAGSLAPGTVAVHNGADDNASGTSAMLAVATRMATELEDVDNHRRILFIAFTGEERGLLGSKYYCSQPRFPISKTVAMLNMDMVGRLRDNELTVYGTGSAAGFADLVTEMNQAMETASRSFRINPVPTGYGPSDHASFYEVGIPVLFYFTGLHNDYHRPSDDFEELNLDGMTRITDMVSQTARRLCTMEDRPEYTQTQKNFQIARQMAVFLGIQMDPDADGVKVSSVMDPSSAKDGGIEVGDVILKAGKTTIESMPDLLNELRKKSPGDVLPMQVQRGEETVDLPIRLRAR